ncbi:Photosystem II reaction center PSB28 protein [Abeliophyllum distichum]|uniref:Photosystem II reaction center Psb28 protein n=1 Tax=Abeliophyllum distichum TaxID=126358 RepID=A0ABD1Q328_9LAMI
MALLQSFAISSPISHYSQQPYSPPGFAFGGIHPRVRSSFNGQSLCLPQSSFPRRTQTRRMARLSIMMIKPTIQFIQGTDEQTVPDVRLTKSRDGTNGIEAKYIMRTPREWDRFMRFMERYANENGLSFVKK